MRLGLLITTYALLALRWWLAWCGRRTGRPFQVLSGFPWR